MTLIYYMRREFTKLTQLVVNQSSGRFSSPVCGSCYHDTGDLQRNISIISVFCLKDSATGVKEMFARKLIIEEFDVDGDQR